MSSVVPLDPRVNPGFLKLDLYCRGLRLHASCTVRGRRRPAGDAGAGGPGLGPRAAPAARASRERARRRGLRRREPLRAAGATSGDGRYDLHRDGEPCTAYACRRAPAWYDALTTTGKPMRRVGTLQGTYLAVYPAQVCHFWVQGRAATGARELPLLLGGSEPRRRRGARQERRRGARGRARGPARERDHVRRLQHGPLRRLRVPRRPRAVRAAREGGDRAPGRRPDAALRPRGRLRPPPRTRRQSRQLLLRGVRPRGLPRALPRQGPDLRPPGVPAGHRHVHGARAPRQAPHPRPLGRERRADRRPRVARRARSRRSTG